MSSALETSLVEQGLLYRVARALGAPSGRRGLIRIGLVIAAITWVPLLVLILTTHVGSEPVIPFRWSLGTHARLLITIPLFFLAEAAFDARARDVLRRLVDAGIVTTADRERLDAALAQAVRWRGAWLTEAALVVLTILLIVGGVRTDLPGGLSTWRVAQDGGMSRVTPAGWWYALVALPFFQFLVWRWCLLLFLWGRVLWRISRLDLQLTATHPDLAGGLGGLGVAHVDLAPLSLGGASMLAASYGETLLFGGASIRDYVLPFAAVVLGSTAVLVAPLAFFSRRLIRLRQHGLLEYGQFATTYVRAFETKWLHGGASPGEALLGSADVQSLADLGNSFGVIRNIRPLPIGGTQILTLLAAAALPSAPLALIVLPLDELIIQGAKSLFGV